MELKKCARCGSFYVNDNQVCPKCMGKDTLELQALRGFFEDNDTKYTKFDITASTGISIRNLERYLNYEEFKGYSALAENMDKVNKGSNNIKEDAK
jgi:hypothetical protein